MRLVDGLAFVRAFVGCWTVAAATAAYAQLDSFVLEMTPAEAARTAFEQPYGKALVTEAAKVFRRAPILGASRRRSSMSHSSKRKRASFWSATARE